MDILLLFFLIFLFADFNDKVAPFPPLNLRPASSSSLTRASLFAFRSIRCVTSEERTDILKTFLSNFSAVHIPAHCLQLILYSLATIVILTCKLSSILGLFYLTSNKISGIAAFSIFINDLCLTTNATSRMLLPATIELGCQSTLDVQQNVVGFLKLRLVY